MKKIEAFSAWFCTCLGITLVFGSILVVPSQAFANDYTGQCAYYAPYPQDPTPCCMNYCGDDSTCWTQCCTDGCASNDTDCVTACQQAQKKCLGDSCESSTNCFNQTGGACDKLSTYCTAMTKGCETCICRNNVGICSCRPK